MRRVLLAIREISGNSLANLVCVLAINNVIVHAVILLHLLSLYANMH